MTEAPDLRSWSALDSDRPVVVVQGLGFVGCAMVAAVAQARDDSGRPRFTVLGVDRDTPVGRPRIEALRAGRSPVVSADPSLEEALSAAHREGRMTATADPEAYAVADVVVVDVNLDVDVDDAGRPAVRDAPFREALGTVAERIGEETLVLVETTVPPGTTERIARPLFEEAFARRGLDPRRLLLAHSYERVMPGPDYLRSITHFPRVFAGIDERSAARARRFLEAVVATDEHPLSEVRSPAASELGKVLENSYRAMNIAFVQEWTEFAQAAGVDLFEVVDAIRRRPTHRNLMRPGLGVGGYCLTKDALLADLGFRQHFGGAGLPTSVRALEINEEMPSFAIRLLERAAGPLSGQRIALFGVSYLPDVGDTRSSPSRPVVEHCLAAGASVVLHDPMVRDWPEVDLPIARSTDAVRRHDPTIAVFCVPHSLYLTWNAEKILEAMPSLERLVDAFDVVSEETARELRARGVGLTGVGKGHWEPRSA